MVLTIQNIESLTGLTVHGRELSKVSIESRYGEGSTSYVFHFPAIPYKSFNPNNYKQWEDSFEVHLYRTPKFGGYELFVMGLHGVTCMEISKSDIRNKQEFLSRLEIVVGRCKRYWEENA